MDAGLLTFSWSGDELTTKIHASIKETVYRDLDHKIMRLPAKPSQRPSKESIKLQAAKARCSVKAA
jgi:hypothetical protein